MSIECEWLKFLEHNDANNVAQDEADYSSISRLASANVNDGDDDSVNVTNSNSAHLLQASACACAIPEQNFAKNCSNIYISTKTKILFLNKSLDIFTTFWLLPITDYNKQEKGISKSNSHLKTGMNMKKW